MNPVKGRVNRIETIERAITAAPASTSSAPASCEPHDPRTTARDVGGPHIPLMTVRHRGRRLLVGRRQVGAGDGIGRQLVHGARQAAVPGGDGGVNGQGAACALARQGDLPGVAAEAAGVLDQPGMGSVERLEGQAPAPLHSHTGDACRRTARAARSRSRVSDAIPLDEYPRAGGGAEPEVVRSAIPPLRVRGRGRGDATDPIADLTMRERRRSRVTPQPQSAMSKEHWRSAML